MLGPIPVTISTSDGCADINHRGLGEKPSRGECADRLKAATEGSAPNRGTVFRHDALVRERQCELAAAISISLPATMELNHGLG